MVVSFCCSVYVTLPLSYGGPLEHINAGHIPHLHYNVVCESWLQRTHTHTACVCILSGFD